MHECVKEGLQMHKETTEPFTWSSGVTSGELLDVVRAQGCRCQAGSTYTDLYQVHEFDWHRRSQRT